MKVFESYVDASEGSVGVRVEYPLRVDAEMNELCRGELLVEAVVPFAGAWRRMRRCEKRGLLRRRVGIAQSVAEEFQDNAAAWLLFGNALYDVGCFEESVAGYESGVAVSNDAVMSFWLRSQQVASWCHFVERSEGSDVLEGITEGLAAVKECREVAGGATPFGAVFVELYGVVLCSFEALVFSEQFMAKSGNMVKIGKSNESGFSIARLVDMAGAWYRVHGEMEEYYGRTVGVENRGDLEQIMELLAKHRAWLRQS